MAEEKKDKEFKVDWKSAIRKGIWFAVIGFVVLMLYQYYQNQTLAQKGVPLSDRRVIRETNLTLPDPEADRPLVQPVSFRFTVTKGTRWQYEAPAGVYVRVAPINPEPDLVYKHWINDRPRATIRLREFKYLPDIQSKHMVGITIDQCSAESQEFGIYFSDVRYGVPEPRKWYAHMLHKAQELESAPPGSEG